MNSKKLAALLYDWHNSHCLHRQNQDITFWKLFCSKLGSTTLVLGAGTGRVAIPLAKSGKTIVAIDLDKERLARIPKNIPGLYTLVADFTQSYLTNIADCAIVPYSSWQLIEPRKALKKAITFSYQALRPGGQLCIDMSSSFSYKTVSKWKVKIEGECSGLGKIREWQRSQIESDSWVLDLRWEDQDGKILLELRERWYFHKRELMLKYLFQEGFHLIHELNGYGSKETEYRHIYIVKKPLALYPSGII